VVELSRVIKDGVIPFNADTLQNGMNPIMNRPIR
jgi:hypothetical protein